MPVPDTGDRWSGKVNEVTLGATKEHGGTRGTTITVGGAQVMPFAGEREKRGRRPVIAADVLDAVPGEYPSTLVEAYKDVLEDPGAWAVKAVNECKADLICIKLDGTHPDKGDRSPGEAVKVVQAVKEAVDVPLIIWGSESDAKDNAVMPKVSEVVKGENALLGVITKDNYKTLTAVALADGHNVIALAPIDINIAKQVNILASDMSFPLGRIVMFQTTGALGYGLEYVYSIHERERLAALGGDKMMAMPTIADVGSEAWRAKEAKTPDAEAPDWGPQDERGPMWEAITAVSLLQTGADIIRMRHPGAMAVVRDYIDRLYA
ncbi:MAG: acetyl-CoA decarbonylase/synthase complex subunit delta [Planctomycetes bacterium SM23_65]|nr:MAG: acetyl-CoA decarbonylase/synthase complex subunit delta [Planctomycetes bacterium SM23_65]